MKPLKTGVILVLAVAVDFDLSCAVAGPLANHPLAFNDGNGPAGGAWSGTGTYFQIPDHVMEGTVEWAVFGPGQFPFTGLNGWTPAPGQLTYAYQIINTGAAGVTVFDPSSPSQHGRLSNLGEVGLGGAQEFSPIQISQEITSYLYYDFDAEEGPTLTGTSTGLVASSPYLPSVQTLWAVRGGGFAPFNMSNPSIGTPSGVLYTQNLPGDYNNNGKVDAADYVLWRKHLGQMFQLTNEANNTTPGEVTPEDYVVWRNNFGQPAAANTAFLVPEPSTLLLGVLAGVSLLLKRKRLSPSSLQHLRAYFSLEIWNSL